MECLRCTFAAYLTLSLLQAVCLPIHSAPFRIPITERVLYSVTYLRLSGHASVSVEVNIHLVIRERIMPAVLSVIYYLT